MRKALALIIAVVAAGCSDAAAPTTTTQPTTTPTTSTTVAATVATTAAPPTTTMTTAAPSPTTTTAPPAPLQQLAWDVLATGLTRPTAVVAVPGTTDLLVAVADGTAYLLGEEGLSAEPFLDLGEAVNDTGIEQGLLGLAFHPTDPTRLFAYYSGPDLDTHLVEVLAGTGDAASARPILTVTQPTDRHQAGMVQFGSDGYLYLSIGDGGDGGTQGQDPGSLLGTIIRVDVDGAEPYAIPGDNPFAAGGGAPEVIAYGLRNPWRFSIDGGTLYIGDVGQDDWEEIDVMALDLEPHNFGWPVTEGAHCFSERACDPTEFDSPVVEYSHDDGCSVTGGLVYRGRAIPEIDGHYFYADWCRQWVRSFRYLDGTATDERQWPELDGFGQINSFGLDGDGELLVVTWGGEVARLVPLRAQG